MLRGSCLIVVAAAACGSHSPPEPFHARAAGSDAPLDPTPASDSCRTTLEADRTREDRRAAAALDRAIRAQSLLPLDVGEQGDKGDPDDVDRSPPKRSTHPVHGADGKSRLVVGEIFGCHGDPPLAAMDQDHHVFVVHPQLRPGSRRTVLECMNDCSGACGINVPPRAALAIVPDDAVLTADRDLVVPIDVQVVFTFAKTQPCNVP